MTSRPALLSKLFLASLFLLTAVVLPIDGFAAKAAAAGDPAPVAGTDYVEIEGGKPYLPVAGKIEVAEVFSYACHHCANFQPKVDAWKRKLPADVRFHYVPLPHDSNDPFALAYFAAEAAGALGKTHDATFRAVHEERVLPRNATIEEIGDFYGRLGLDATKLKVSMQTPRIVDKLQPARQFAIDSGLEGTPTLIVNGKYRVTGRTFEDALRIADYLIKHERAAARRR